MLSTREYQIIIKLLDTNEVIRIKELSNELNVSDRTIKYDLKNVRNWFLTQDIFLHSRPNKGIWIEEDYVKRNKVKESIYNNRNVSFLMPNDRIKEIITILILDSNHVTALDISERLLVSRNTIINDLHLVEEYIKPWQVTLSRKPRVGFQIKGKEIYKRILLENVIQSNLSNHDIYKIMMNITKENEKNNFIINPCLKDGYNLAEKYLRKVFKSDNYDKFDSFSLLSILFRLTISISRLQMGYTLGNYHVIDESFCQNDEEKIVLQLMKKAYKDMKLPLFKDEFDYILRGNEKKSNQVDLVKVTKKIIHYVSKQESINYKNDSKLYSNLLAHLSLRFQNGLINTTEYNPFTDEIKQNYKDLFNNVKKAFEK